MKTIIIIFAVIAALAGLAYKVYNDNYTKNVSFSSGNVKFVEQNLDVKVKIAESHAEREQGLMFVKELPENEGMLFIFPNEAKQGFWMHNTYISLDIMYVGSDLKIRKIYHSAEPMSDKVLSSVMPAKYVVEVNGGYAKKHNINEGDKIEFIQK